MLLQADDVRGVYAIPPTPARDGADHWSATDTVDIEESARVVDQLIVDGVDGIIVLGTTGECATLTETEYRQFAETVVSAAAGRVPTFVGATALGTHQTIERLRIVQDLGATGTMLGLPMWQPCTEDMALRFYASIAEAFPDLTIMVYMNVRAFRFDFPVSFWEKLREVAPTVTCAKYGSAPPLPEVVEATQGQVRFLVADMAAAPMAEAMPDLVKACWSTSAGMGPQPVIALMDAINESDWLRVKDIGADIAWAVETFFPPDRDQFGLYNIQLEKLRMAAAGYCTPGPIRPPYDLVPEDYAEGAAEAGRRWAELVTRYARVR